MKAKPAKIKPQSEEDKRNDYAARLTELETEINTYPAKPEERALPSLDAVKEAEEGGEKVVAFTYQGRTYSIGRADRTFAGSHHARGVRHIRFYEEGKEVLCIEGDFEDQQFGSNFKFQTVEVLIAGEWEKDFMALSDELMRYKAKRRQTFLKKRAADHAKRLRSS